MDMDVEEAASFVSQWCELVNGYMHAVQMVRAIAVASAAAALLVHLAGTHRCLQA